MKEFQEILKKIAWFGDGEKAILATVMDVVGAGYRRPGARMLIDENGYSIGTVSGGCLEADVLERAKKVLETSEANVVIYDTTADENSVFGLGMGCHGIVRVLLESVEKNNLLLNAFRAAIENRQTQIVATLISTSGNFPIGGRVFYDRSKKFISKNLPVFMESFSRLRSDCRKLFDGKDVSTNQTYEIKNEREENETLEFFIEKIEPPVSLKLFGAGYDALPLADFAKNLGWHLVVIDHRQAFATAQRFPAADEIILGRAKEFDENFFQDENSVAVLMTHNYERDREILPRLLKSNFLYVGALGPKTRTAKLLEESGETFSDEQLSKLFAPVGLDIGAKTPEEIAFSIVAEINAVLTNRAGGFLRNRQGSIYGRNE